MHLFKFKFQLLQQFQMWHAVPTVESDGEEWEDAGGHGHQGREVVDYAVRQAKVPFPTKN